MASVTGADPAVTHFTEPARERAKRDLGEQLRQERRVALVINTKSRSGQSAYREAQRLIASHGVTLAASHPVSDPSRFTETVGQCVADGHSLVILGGGDGSISASMDFFANRAVALGLLPVGTANSFARSLGLPLDLPGAVDVAINGRLVDVDLGRINGHCFANAAAIGLQPAIARAVPHGLKKVAGRVGYLLVAAVMLMRQKPFRCAIRFEDGRVEDFPEALEVRIANGGYKGGMLIAREADVESGDLVVHVVKGRSHFRLAKVWAQIAIGIAPSTDHLVAMRGVRFAVTTDPPHHVSIDGEVVTKTPLEVGIARQALFVMTPRDHTDLS